MAVVVQSIGTLADVTAGWQTLTVRSTVQLYNEFYYDYATLYRTQPNVRTCVDFLARNVAQLGLHVFRRAGETDRVRLRDHPLAVTLGQPLPAVFKVTGYRLIESLMADLGVYFNAYWLKIRRPDAAAGAGGRSPIGLLRLPPTYVTVKGSLVPTGYEINLGTRLLTVDCDQVVHLRGYNPENPVAGLSPLETLRRVLAEEHAAGDYREYFWRNAARMGGIIERPPAAPQWSQTARERFKAEFEALYSGGENSGKTAILEEGMTWRMGTFNAQESEYLEGRKLTREECARAYHIPLPMVGILDHATFSNIREQHRNLYQDSLGPWLALIEQDIELQLLPEFDDTEGVYVEFNINEKLQGSFEEQMTALQAAVGRPWMLADEARARLNMPALGGDAARLVTPLNVLVGGNTGNTDGMKALKALKGLEGLEGEVDPTLPEVRERYREKWARLLVRTFERQRGAVMSRVGKQSGGLRHEREEGLLYERTKDEVGALGAAPDIVVLWDSERWNRELEADFYGLGAATALEFARFTAQAAGAQLEEEELLPWLVENARIAAEYVNAATREQVEVGLRADDVRGALTTVFETAIGVRAAQIAMGRVTSLGNWGAMQGARQGGLGMKTWRVHSSNPRPSHAAQNGMTIPMRERFPNGLMWPGDPAGSAEENANCSCSVAFRNH